MLKRIIAAAFSAFALAGLFSCTPVSVAPVLTESPPSAQTVTPEFTSFSPTQTPTPAAGSEQLLLFEPSVAAEPVSIASAPALLIKGLLIEPGSQQETELLCALLGDGFGAKSIDPPVYQSISGDSSVMLVDGVYFYNNSGKDGLSVDEFTERLFSAPALAGLERSAPNEVSPYTYSVNRIVNQMPVYRLFTTEGALISFDGKVCACDISFSRLEEIPGDIAIMPFDEALKLVNAAMSESEAYDNSQTFLVKDAHLVYDCPRAGDGYDETALVPHWRIRYPALGTFDIGMSEGIEMEIEFSVMVNCLTGEVDFR